MTVLEVALSEYGTKEIVGGKHNPEVLKYFHDMGHDWIKTDETAWCSAFINWCAMWADKPFSDKLDARSWLDVGTEVEVPDVGDVVVLWRESIGSWKGHVGLFIRQTDKFIYVLGGNQNNQVNIKAYPKNRLLGYRRL